MQPTGNPLTSHEPWSLHTLYFDLDNILGGVIEFSLWKLVQAHTQFVDLRPNLASCTRFLVQRYRCQGWTSNLPEEHPKHQRRTKNRRTSQLAMLAVKNSRDRTARTPILPVIMFQSFPACRVSERCPEGVSVSHRKFIPALCLGGMLMWINVHTWQSTWQSSGVIATSPWEGIL